MKTKKLNILFVSIFAFLFLIGFANAVINYQSTNSVLERTISEGATSTNFYINLSALDTNQTVTNWKMESFTSSNPALTESDVSFSFPSEYTIQLGESRLFAINLNNIDSDFVGTSVFTINITGETPSSENYKTVELTLVVEESTSTEPEEVNECKVTGDNDHLDISVKDITIVKGYGDDYEWFPLDEIEVEIDVENKGDEKIKNIVVGWGLYNVDSGDWIIDDEESDFDLKDGDEENLVINFKLDDNIDELNDGDYVFYVWATGEDTELDVDTCVTDSDSIEIIIEDDFVVLGDFEMLETVSCGGEIQISAKVWNIGEDDQDEVSVIIYNKELGLNEQVEIGDIDAFDSEPLDFTFQIPNDAEEKTYSIKFTVYDDSNDIYENDYDDEQSIYSVFLKVEGSCSVAEASVNAFLVSGGEAGKPLVVKATIVNTGDKTSTYLINAASYTEWASSAILDKSSLTLDAGKTGEVSFTFDVKGDVSGNKLFYLEVLSENELIVNQPVQVEITKKSWGITGNLISGDNKYIWGIGLLNLILVILIIVLAVRISRK